MLNRRDFLRALCALLAAPAFARGAARATDSRILLAAFSVLEPEAAVPEEWQPYGFKNIRNRTRYALVADEGRTVLCAKAQDSASGIVRRVRFDPREYPLLRWSWKISNTLPKADITRKDGDDFPARIYVTFDYPKSKLPFTERAKVELAELLYREPLPLATLCYVWDGKAAVGTIAPSPYTGRVRIIVAASGAGRVGRWTAFERDLARDFTAAFGEPPPAVSGIVLAADTDNTGAAVTTYFGDISVNKH